MGMLVDVDVIMEVWKKNDLIREVAPKGTSMTNMGKHFQSPLRIYEEYKFDFETHTESLERAR